MKKEKKEAFQKKIFFHNAYFYIATPLFVFIVCLVSSTHVFGAINATSTDITEFFPNIDDSANNQENTQAAQILERFRGLIPNATIDALSSTNKVVIQTNRITSPDTVDIFTKNLKLGDIDTEVLLLQKILNEDPDTMVSVSGYGSLGNETTYFGQKTKVAVIKLQNKHAGEVLIPNGLSFGTGYFGPSTRSMLNTARKNKSKTTSVVTSKASAESLASTIPNGNVSGLGETVKITSLEPTHGKNGTLVTIHGLGMTPTANKIIAGGETIYNVPSSDGKTLIFIMESPVFLDLTGMSVASSTYIQNNFSTYKTAEFPSLKYPVCVINDSGMSNCAFFNIDI